MRARPEFRVREREGGEETVASSCARINRLRSNSLGALFATANARPVCRD